MPAGSGDAAPAPLSVPEGLAIPERGRAFWFEGVGGLRLRAALFPAPEPRGSVVLSTGRSEYIEKYLEAIGEWVARGFTVLAHDWRGQGLSQRLAADRLKGCADGFDDFIADFHRLMDQYGAGLPEPRIAFGHSMGGGLTVASLMRRQAGIAGAIVTAPMFGLLIARNPVIRPAVWLMASAGLRQAFVERRRPDPFAMPFEGNILTSDARRFARMQRHLVQNPDLALGAVTWGWIDSALVLTGRLTHDPALGRLSLPITVLEAGEEALVDNAAIEAVVQRLPSARLIRVPAARHEILMEADAVRAVFWRAFDDLAAQVGA